MPMLLAGERLRALRFRVLRLPDAERIGECCPIDADPVCVCAAVEPDCVPGPDCYEFFGRHAEAAADICAHVAAVCERIEIYFRETHDVDTGMVGVNAKIEGFQDGILSLVITDIARSIPSCVLLNSRRVDALLPAT